MCAFGTLTWSGVDVAGSVLLPMTNTPEIALPDSESLSCREGWRENRSPRHLYSTVVLWLHIVVLNMFFGLFYDWHIYLFV